MHSVQSIRRFLHRGARHPAAVMEGSSIPVCRMASHVHLDRHVKTPCARKLPLLGTMYAVMRVRLQQGRD